MSVSTVPQNHIVLDGISWQTYEHLLEELDGRAVRLTYDRGTLEIMSPGQRHERVKSLLGRMVEQLTLELGIPIRSAGSTTWRSAALEKGLEPDECYWIQNEPKIRALVEVEVGVDPPVDLAIEVDDWSCSIDRLGIYAALGVPEVWRWDRRLHVLVLEGDGYSEAATSRCFPWLPMAEFEAWLDRQTVAGAPDETSWMRAFAAWARTLDNNG